MRKTSFVIASVVCEAISTTALGDWNYVLHDLRPMSRITQVRQFVLNRIGCYFLRIVKYCDLNLIAKAIHDT